MKKERTIRLTCERARAFPIEKALAKLGHFPTKTNDKEAWFLSPFRSENQASFKVSKKLNRWYDHGEGKDGNVIDLICLITKSTVSQTLKFIAQDQDSFSFHQQPVIETEKDKGLQILYARPLQHYSLLKYVAKRSISIDTVAMYCYEVHYLHKGRSYFAIGLKNNSDGWEFRNKYYKNSSSPKDVIHLQNGNSSLIVTEGMFDLLSLMERDKHLMEANDLAGKNAVHLMMQQQPKCTDRSKLYENFKDVNGWWTSQKK